MVAMNGEQDKLKKKLLINIRNQTNFDCNCIFIDVLSSSKVMLLIEGVLPFATFFAGSTRRLLIIRFENEKRTTYIQGKYDLKRY